LARSRPDLVALYFLFLLPWWEEKGDGGVKEFVSVSGGVAAVPSVGAFAGQEAGAGLRD
jgi:hypothetical protein